MRSSRACGRRRSIPRSDRIRARPCLEPLEDRTLLNGTSLPGVVDFNALSLDPGSYASSRILVRFRADADPAAVAGIPGGTTLGPPLPLVPGLREVLLAPGVSVPDALKAYQANPQVLYAEPDYVVRADVIPNDPQFPSLWGLNNTGQTGGTPGADIAAPAAWDITTGSSNTVVAVIDTGVDYNHPDLKANMWVNPGEIPGNGIDDDGDGFRDDVYGADFVNNDGDPMDDFGHGTHVAGTLGARGNNGIGVAGVNWNVRIMALKFLDASGSGYTSGAIAALNYAVAKGATISNNSWGGGSFDQGLYDAIKAAGTAGHIFVAAAGNDSSNNDSFPAYPASYNLPNIISVAATDHNDALAGFSNYGATTVDLGAPGVNILSTVPTSGPLGDPSGYRYLSGTSMATPHVTGVVALVRSLHPEWAYTQVIDQVLSAADPVPSLAGKTVTGGRLNAARAVGLDFGPRVVAQSPSGSTNGSVSSLQLTFSEPIQPGTFTTEDVVSFTGPGGADLRSMITGVSGSGMTFTVSFATQAALGSYSMVIGPDVRDDGPSHNQMDQDRDGINGEIPADRYTATFTITNELIFPSPDVPAPIEVLYTTISYLTIGDAYKSVTIADLNLQLNINYPDVYDLNISLYSPRGTFVPLVWDNLYVSGRNFENTIFDDQAATPISAGTAPYRGSYRPDGRLSAVNGEGVVGTWELHIDAYPYTDLFNSGQLTYWSLIVQPQGSSNRPPDAVNDASSTLEDKAVTVAVLANDTDPDNDPLTVTGVTQGTKGAVVINANNTVTYTPNANANGTDTFQYTISDGKGGSDTATVTVTINPVNDAPAGADKTVSIPKNTAYTFGGADFGFSDPNDSPANAFLAVQITTLPDVGSLTLGGAAVTAGQFVTKVDLDAGKLRFAPAADASGAPYASFTVQVQDDGGTANGGADLDPTPNTITINVTAGNNPPVADDQDVTTAEDTARAITLTGSDPDGDALTFSILSGPSHGTLTGSGANQTYTPSKDYNGPDSFIFQVSDGRGGTDTGTVRITVTPVNDPPVASNDSYTTAEDTPLSISAAQGVLGNDADVEGNPLTAVLVTGPAHGALTLNADGSFSYTPAANYNGPDSFTYKANDGALSSNTATVSITVSPVNDPPVAVNDSYSVDKGGTLAPPAPGVLGNDADVDGDPLTAVLVTGPSHGTLTLNADGSFTYVHDGSETTSDGFTYRASDGTADSNVATVSITIQSLYYFSTTVGGTLGGVSFTDADILRLAVGASGPQFSLYFDGSDVGLGGNQTAEDIDAFAFLPDGSIIVSTVGPFSVFTTYSSPGVGSGPTLTGTGSDLLRFWPQSLGANTAGVWELYFDGSDVGLSSSSENIDAVAVLTDDRIVISTSGSFRVPSGSGSLTGADEDLLVFTPLELGETTAGTWSLYFDGTAVGLGESGSEDVDALFISESEEPDVQPTLYFSTIGNFSVPGLGGANEDVFAFHPTLGQREPFTSGTFGPGLTLDGSLYGLGSFDIDSIYLGVAPNQNLVGSLGGSATWGGSQAGVTTVTASGNTSLGDFPSGGSGFREWNSIPAKHDLLPTNADRFASVIAVQAPPAGTERSQGAGPRATGGGAHPLPRASADLLSALDSLFAPRGLQGDTPSPPRSGRASGSADTGGGPADVLSAEVLWAWFTYTKKRTL